MVTLLTIQHDPEGKLLGPLYKVLPLLNDLFDERIIVITTNTHNDYTTEGDYKGYKSFPFITFHRAMQGMADARMYVIAMALSRMPFSKPVKDDYYFYCDLDRLIHWATIHPGELEKVVWRVGNSKDYIIIGRKHLAMQSHPLLQLKTEEVMNMIVREKVGIDMDVFAGARVFSYQAAKWISEQSTANHGAQDIEWPMIVKNNGGLIGYIEVDGLAYESGPLDIRHSREDEINLRMTNLKSVLEFLGDK